MGRGLPTETMGPIPIEAMHTLVSVHANICMRMLLFTHLQIFLCVHGRTRTPVSTFTSPYNHSQMRTHECPRPHVYTNRHMGPNTYRCSWVPWWLVPSLGPQAAHLVDDVDTITQPLPPQDGVQIVEPVA